MNQKDKMMEITIVKMNECRNAILESIHKLRYQSFIIQYNNKVLKF